ncbi:hypothetical protein [Haloplanus rubicundus]|uniref:hypothetical protein n=1 Tax=Haloplanus rubicundus TaxID=1547898 RepID=UPI0013005F09|nr:hypothetical protein [Haloplanus rubicundus]
MPEIEITPEQEERLRALQEDIARDVVGKYGHVRPRDAVEYLLDRYEDDDDADPGAAHAGGDADADPEGDTDAADDDTEADGDTGGTDAAAARVVANEDGDATDGAGGDAMLNEMMSLLDTHSDKWGESSGDERYQVDLPDGSTEQVRTKDDVKALLFKHYR